MLKYILSPDVSYKKLILLQKYFNSLMLKYVKINIKTKNVL